MSGIGLAARIPEVEGTAALACTTSRARRSGVAGGAGAGDAAGPLSPPPHRGPGRVLPRRPGTRSVFTSARASGAQRSDTTTRANSDAAGRMAGAPDDEAGVAGGGGPGRPGGAVQAEQRQLP